MSTGAKLERGAAALAKAPLLTVQDLMQHYGVCENTIHNWRRNGRLPAPAKPGGKTPLWHPLDILRSDLKS